MFFLQALPPLKLGSSSLGKMRSLLDFGTFHGIRMASVVFADAEGKNCDALYSDKVVMELLKRRNFDVVFADSHMSAVR